MALIEVRNLTKHYRMGDSIVHALDGANLTIEQGEFIAITGASGSGKSTMMHLLGCLDRPTSGTYLLNGRNVSELSDRELARVRNQFVGFVFQTFNLIQRTTAVENVAVPLFYARQTHTFGPAKRALERVGLGSRAHHRPNELSGGERQRVAIARAIVSDPLLILADEPTGNLDSKTGEQIMKIFHELNAQGVTVILVTHEPDVARQARRIVQMRDGKIVTDRPTQELYGDSAPAVPEPRGAAAARTAGVTAPAGMVAPGVSAPAATHATPPGEPELVLPGGGGALRVSAEAQPAAGLSGALFCGVASPLLVLTAIVLNMTIPREFMRPGAVPDPMTIFKGTGVLIALALSLILAIVAIVLSAGVMRRIAREPGAWTGIYRARLAQVLGWIVVIVMIGSVALSTFRRGAA